LKEYVIVRVQGLKLHLLDKRDYERLVDNPEARERYIGVDVFKDPLRARRVVYRKLRDRAKFLGELNPEYAKFCDLFLLRIECENVKALLRAVSSEGWELPWIPFENYTRIRHIQRLGDVKEVLEYVDKSTPLSVSYEHIRLYLGEPRRVHVEMILDAAYYEALKREAKRVFSESVRQLIDLDALKMLTYWLAVAPNECYELVHLGLLDPLQPSWMLEKGGIRVSNIAEALHALRSSDLLDLVSKRQVGRLCESLEKRYVGELRKALLKEKFTDVSVYYYIYMCYTEARNVDRIVQGVTRGAPREIILSSLILPERE